MIIQFYVEIKTLQSVKPAPVIDPSTNLADWLPPEIFRQ